MSITDELRAWAKGSTLSSWTAEHLTAIADHIDAEHEKACDDAWDNGYEADYLGIEKWLTEHPQVMEHPGWICLPKDADGECIQPSDIPYLTKANDGERLAFRPSLELRQDGTWRFAGWPLDRYRISKPTVEDVLREFTDAILEWAGKSGTVAEVGTWSDVAAEYAAKLRLAGEDA